MSSDPPAYEPPGPEITGDNAVDNNNGGDTFKDEPGSGDYNDEGDPVKWNFSPPCIILLVILNLIALGAVGYLIWYAVDAAQETNAPTLSPTIITTPAPTMSNRPSFVPSVSSGPSIGPSNAPTVLSTPAPTSSSQPTPITSSSPTRSPFSCNLCGTGKAMSTTNLSANVSFGSRVTRTCQELLTDQNNGDILEEQCAALYDQILANCGCDSTATIGARDDAAVEALITAKSIDTTLTDEKAALTALLSTSTDTYFATAKTTLTDAEVVQRYLVILAYYQLNVQSLLTSTLYAASECSGTWSPVVIACEYGQVTSVHFDATVEVPASSPPVIPLDLTKLDYVQTLWINNYSFASTLPATITASATLTDLQLINNSLTGTIPDALFELRSLVTLDMKTNALSGNIGAKTKIKQLIRLTYLDLGTNTITGTIPTCELSTTPTTMITDCAAEVTCTCCTSCADQTTGTV
mmetsp:Transcript_14583/g.35229  ORF Transcript_14583/g.35229 Transcript_14583/m.35229 type:complete len:466 (+) Transcript_14583:130-1527(+)|eukprot:CAMPEP_0113632018 /NCGR_PEP_ID=MMETSP0017_2-20120614/16640_1 /TAXON_ID=2856 /ORGANISM="Cylindrotheca closterium" /LENGTH=465 /DNA_ID=CAMNT_0000542553 /DNA_START=105 /DNA_END=1502 /DNA_ORIENTATION=+ /assembly_acc=CAM_ASM_000147